MSNPILARGHVFNFHGYDVTVRQLSKIFTKNYQTIRNRIVQGWPIEAALAAEPMGNWTVFTVDILMQQKWVMAYVLSTLESHFNPKSTKIKKVSKREQPVVVDASKPSSTKVSRQVHQTLDEMVHLLDVMTDGKATFTSEVRLRFLVLANAIRSQVGEP